MGLRTIEQKITAGADFDGTLPTGATTQGNDLESFTAQAAGGLFDFAQDKPITIQQIAIVFGGQSTWSLVLVDADATELPVDDGTTETEYLDWNIELVLLKGQKLKLVTTGASTAMRAHVTAETRPR